MTINKKRALGRGLNAILESPDTDITSKDISGNYVVGAIAKIKTDKIIANPFQPRTDFEEQALKELAESIKKQGIIQPITVRKLGYDKYQLISGERRLKASSMAGLDEIPAYIRVANDQQMLEMSLVENIQRKSLNAIEIAISYQRLIKECDLTQEKLSANVGKDRTTISNYLRLLKLPAEIQIALRDGIITVGHARAIINIEDAETQLNIFKNIIKKNLSVRAVEDIVRNINNVKPKAKPKNIPLPEKYKSAKNKLSDKFNTNIDIKRDAKGKGKIVFTFKSDKELNNIISIIDKNILDD
ncbi:MAG: ParB/RepB/Spo0J family partition protein [Bacteroidales bacterium]|nr:ParB/RepB/Spo0J family partition protein [Bacteroidales bacterium]